MDYSLHYRIAELLEKEGGFQNPPILYNPDPDRQFDESMNRVAQPLPDGRESQFSSRNPADGHGVLLSNFLYHLRLLGYEFNLTPDLVWFMVFRMLGMTLEPEEYPIVEVELRRTAPRGTQFLEPATIPLGEKLYSNKERGLELILSENAEFRVKQDKAIVKARLNRRGEISRTLQENEFSSLETSALAEVRLLRILHPGRDAETIEQSMLRVRKRLQFGGDRLTTCRDYHHYLKEKGAERALPLPNVVINGEGGHWADLLSFAIFPGHLAKILEPHVRERATAGIRITCESATIVPITGSLTIRVVPGVLNPYNLVAQAVQEHINPPRGKWGDRDFKKSLAVAIENQPHSFYAVPEMELVRADTRERFEEIEICPWMLFEIQKDIQLNFV